MAILKALIFDFDGTILDTETADCQAWRDTYSLFGCPFPEDLFLSALGSCEQFDPVAEILKRRSDLNSGAISDCWRQTFDRLISTTHEAAGLRELLSLARAQSVAIAIASNSSLAWVKHHLDRIRLTEEFDTIVTREDVAAEKPDPAIYNTVLQRLAVGASEAIAVEDSVNGVAAAKRAGIYCIAVPNETTRRLCFSSADMMLRSIGELRLPELRKLLA